MGEFEWNDRAGRYVGPGGRFVSTRAVREALNHATERAGQRMAEASTALRDGRISLRDWQMTMRREVKNVTLYSSASVKGGWAQMGPADFGRAGQRVREQYKYLDRFAAQIASGEVPTDGRMINRASLYGKSGRQTAQLFERVEKKARGMTEERSLITAADNCAGCLQEESRGWVPIGELVPVGSRECSHNCGCDIEYR